MRYQQLIDSLIVKSAIKILIFSCAFPPFLNGFPQGYRNRLDIPNQLIVEAYEKAIGQNVLIAVNSRIFFGYFSVCMDGKGFDYGNSFPSFDGHQMSDALLWLGQTDVLRANWEFVKKFQKQNGALPLAFLSEAAGQNIGLAHFEASVDHIGGLYKHWVPKDPLRSLAGTNYFQNADIFSSFTHDKKWLFENLPSGNISADYLASMINDKGAVGGAGYYIERPTRVE